MRKRYDTYDMLKFGHLAIVILFILIIMVAFSKAGEEAEQLRKEYQEELNVCIENGYTVFLDGEEVDANKIDLSLYSTSINHEEQYVYATKEDSHSDGSGIPIFFPLFFR